MEPTRNPADDESAEDALWESFFYRHKRHINVALDTLTNQYGHLATEPSFGNVRRIVFEAYRAGVLAGYGMATAEQEQLADATREPVAPPIERTDAAETLFTATVERRALTLAQQKLIRTFAERVARDENHGVLSAPIMGRAIEDVIGKQEG